MRMCGKSIGNMGIFGKKKKEEVDEEDLIQEDEAKGRKLTRKLKDLNPENKKKRKEPPKPWGFKERIIVLVFFVATVFISAFLALSARNYSFGGFKTMELNIPSFESFNFFKEETFVLEKDSD